MKKIILFILEFIISKRIHIGFLSYILAIFYMRAIGVDSYHSVAPFISFFIVWAAYLENLTTDKTEDSLGGVPHGLFPFIESKLYPIEKFYILIYVIGVALSLLVSIKCFLYTVFTTIIFSSYVQKWFPAGKGKRKRLKEIFLIKNLMPPVGWIFSVEIIPFITSNSFFIPEYLLLIIIALLCSFREEVKFDIPDIKGDARAGIKTLPNIFGYEITKTILNSVNYIAAILFFSALIILKENNHTVQFEALLINIFPIVTCFLFDHNFVNLLAITKKKEYCNIGILWWSILITIYLVISYPYNIIIFLLLRFSGSFLISLRPQLMGVVYSL